MLLFLPDGLQLATVSLPGRSNEIGSTYAKKTDELSGEQKFMSTASERTSNAIAPAEDCCFNMFKDEQPLLILSWALLQQLQLTHPIVLH